MNFADAQKSAFDVQQKCYIKIFDPNSGFCNITAKYYCFLTLVNFVNDITKPMKSKTFVLANALKSPYFDNAIILRVEFELACLLTFQPLKNKRRRRVNLSVTII